MRWSPPEQKAQPPSFGLGPLPVSSTTPMRGFCRASSSARYSSSTVCGRKALRTSGRLKAMRATPPVVREVVGDVGEGARPRAREPRLGRIEDLGDERRFRHAASLPAVRSRRGWLAASLGSGAAACRGTHPQLGGQRSAARDVESRLELVGPPRSSALAAPPRETCPCDSASAPMIVSSSLCRGAPQCRVVEGLEPALPSPVVGLRVG